MNNFEQKTTDLLDKILKQTNRLVDGQERMDHRIEQVKNSLNLKIELLADRVSNLERQANGK